MEIFLFYFEMAIKITGSEQNYRVGRVSGNTPIFLGLILFYVLDNGFLDIEDITRLLISYEIYQTSLR